MQYHCNTRSIISIFYANPRFVWVRWALHSKLQQLISFMTGSSCSCMQCQQWLHILYISLFSRSKKDIRDVVKRALRQGLEDIDSIDNIIQKRTKTLMSQMIHESDHFINNFLGQCPQVVTVILNTEALGDETASCDP